MLLRALALAGAVVFAGGCHYTPRTNLEWQRAPRCEETYSLCRQGWRERYGWTTDVRRPEDERAACIFPAAACLGTPSFARCKAAQKRCIRGEDALELAPTFEPSVAGLTPELRARVAAAVDLLEFEAHEWDTTWRGPERHLWRARRIEGTSLLLVYDLHPEGVTVFGVVEELPASGAAAEGRGP